MAISYITTGQAKAAAIQLQQQIHEFSAFINTVDGLARNNWTITQTIGGVQVPTTVSAQDQTALTTQYTTLKSALVATFATLP